MAARRIQLPVVAINASPTLAVGTYTGQVVLTSLSGGGMSITIPVTLTVAPARRKRTSTTCLVRLSFSVQTNSSTGPPSQDIQIRNGGSWIPRLDLRKEHLRRWQLVNGNCIKWHFSIDGKRQCSAFKICPEQGLHSGNLRWKPDCFRLLRRQRHDSGERCCRRQRISSQVNGISFTKVFGGANPLATNSTLSSVASTGSELQLSTSPLRQPRGEIGSPHRQTM